MVTKEEFEVIYRMGRGGTALCNVDYTINNAYQSYVMSRSKQYAFSILPSEIRSRLELILSTYLKLIRGVDPNNYEPQCLEEIDNPNEIRIVYRNITDKHKVHVDVRKDWFDIDEAEIASSVLLRFMLERQRREWK